MHANVGGVPFDFYAGTFTELGDPDDRNSNFFTLVLRGGVPADRDRQGRIFVDRDPRSFALLLNALRNGGTTSDIEEMVYRAMQPQLFELLVQDARFYGLHGFLRRLEPLRAWKSSAAQQCAQFVLDQPQRFAFKNDELVVEQSGRLVKYDPFERKVYQHMLLGSIRLAAPPASDGAQPTERYRHNYVEFAISRSFADIQYGIRRMDYVYHAGRKNWHVGECMHGYAADGMGELVSGGKTKTDHHGWPQATTRALYYDYESRALYLLLSKAAGTYNTTVLY